MLAHQKSIIFYKTQLRRVYIVLADKKTFAFPKSKRLLKRREFLEVQEKGFKLFSRIFTVYYLLDEGFADSKIGITVSKKVSKHANKRNLIRRRIREVSRQFILPNLKFTARIVIIAKNSAIEANFSDYKRDLINLLSRKRMI